MDFRDLKQASIEYQNGNSLRDTAKKFGVSRSTLARHFKQNDVAIRQGSAARKHGSTIPLDTQEKIIELNKIKTPLLHICKEVGVSYGRLYNFLKQKNILNGRRFKNLPYEKIIKEYKSGKTISEICEAYDCNWKTIRKILCDSGIEIRDFQDYKLQILDICSLHEDMIQNWKSLSTVARENGVSRFILKDRFLEEGLNLRSKSEEQEIVNLEKHPNFNWDFFAKETEETIYWLGFIAADGAVIGNPSKKMKLSIGLKHTDELHLHKLTRLLNHGTVKQIDMTKYEGYIGDKRVKGGKIAKLEISSSSLCRPIVERGITPRKTHSLELSEKLKKSRHFWRGYIDGDGSLSKLRNKAGNISTVLNLGGASKSVILDFKDFLEAHGISTATVKTRNYKNPFYILTLSGERARMAAELLYKDACVHARLERKHEIALTWSKWSKIHNKTFEAF